MVRHNFINLVIVEGVVYLLIQIIKKGGVKR